MVAETALGFFRSGTEILVVRNPETSRWSVVSVPIDGPAESATERLAPATGRPDAVTLLRSAEPIPSDDDADRRVHPFLFECDARDIAPDPADAIHEWVQPPTFPDRDTEPGLWAAYLTVSSSTATVREDTDHGAVYVSLRALEVLKDRAAAAAEGSDTYDSVAEIARRLRRVHPNMGVIGVRIDRVMASADRTPGSVRDRAIAACLNAVDADRAATERAASLSGDRLLTLSRSGTVEAALESSISGPSSSRNHAARGRESRLPSDRRGPDST